MGSDDLRALIHAVRDRVREEREDRRRELDALANRLESLERRTGDIAVKLIRYGSAAALIFGVLAWFGPTRLAALLKALVAGP